MGVLISRFAEGRLAESAELGNRDIVVVMAGQTNGGGNDNFDSLVDSAPGETVALREGEWLGLTINPRGVGGSG